MTNIKALQQQQQTLQRNKQKEFQRNMSRVLILGGTGFIARNLVKFLIDQQLVSKIRVVDKQLPATAYLSKEFLSYYNNPIVEFKQANLTNAGKLTYPTFFLMLKKVNLIFP